jgi:hypothetical protein
MSCVSESAEDTGISSDTVCLERVTILQYIAS